MIITWGNLSTCINSRMGLLKLLIKTEAFEFFNWRTKDPSFLTCMLKILFVHFNI